MLLDISESILCGHPALKSIDLNVLIPNQFAPQFIVNSDLKDISGTGQTFLKSITKTTHPEVGDYMNTFKDSGIVSQIESKGLSMAYDDLKKLINESGQSFPVYEKRTGENGFSEPGMWGYLKDIYISTKLFQDLVKQNDTYLRLVQSLCDNISAAFSGVVQLKVLPHERSAKFTIQDMNYNPRSTPEAVINLPVFTPGSINSAFMTGAEFSIKLSQEMVNQMVAQSSEGKNASGLTGDIQKVGPQKVSRFMGSDRLYEAGRLTDIPAVTASLEKPTTPPSAPPPHPRAFPGTKFKYYQEKGGKRFILIEPEPAFLREVLTRDVSGKTIYINSPIMSGTKFSMTTLGIGGFTFLGQFTIDHVPTAYNSKNCVWQIADIKQTISNGMWNTTITADCRPLSFIKKAKV